MPRLDLYVRENLLMKLKLGEGEVLIGRGEDCDLQLPNDRVSRHHARIRPADRRAGGYEVEDLSSNGTRINAHLAADSGRLTPGDRIYIENYVFIYQPDHLQAVELSPRIQESTLC